MGNSIRTPRQGKSEASRRIAEAVDDEDWQEFRVSLKGLSTRDKLDKLHDYYTPPRNYPTSCRTHDGVDLVNCDICIRVDNYLKALARGGQLHKGASLQQALEVNWKLDIKS